MYRNNEELIFSDRDEHNFVLNHGAVGDAICSLPAIIFARQNRHPALKLIVWCQPYQVDLFRHLLAPYGEFTVRSIMEFPLKGADRKAMNFGPMSHNAPFHDTHTRNSTHLVDFAFRFLVDKDPPNMAARNYPTAPLGPRTLEGGYVVFPTGYTSENKAFRASVMGPIVEWAADHGYTPVLVGTSKSYTSVTQNGKRIPLVVLNEVEKLPPEVYARCLDLRDKTTLMEVRDICGHAAAVVGVDGGMIHLAGTTDTNIIYAMTATIPQHRYIARQGDPHHKIRYVVPRDLECAGCQSNWTLTYHAYNQCAYGDSLCTFKLHPEDFIVGLKEMGL